jgi:DNA mismatch endonuclease (patch repair protein)
MKGRRRVEEAPSPSASPTSPPSYRGRRSSSPQASAAARGASRKTDTRCEVALRRAIWSAGYRYRKNVGELPGRPDIVFLGGKVAVFCDGDFWHGRDWEIRRQKLMRGSNSGYWVAKIQRNMERDLQNNRLLEEDGWTVLHFWESEINANPLAVSQSVIDILRRMRPQR